MEQKVKGEDGKKLKWVKAGGLEDWKERSSVAV